MYARGNRFDYDKWEELGNIGWSFKDVLPYFKKSEHANFTNDIDVTYHGLNGLQTISLAEDIPGLVSKRILCSYGNILIVLECHYFEWVS